MACESGKSRGLRDAAFGFEKEKTCDATLALEVFEDFPKRSDIPQ